MKVATAEQNRLCDTLAINKYGIPGLTLMENAGRGTVAAMESRFGSLAGRSVAILVGPGNNGGDGLVIARLLHQLGAAVRVIMAVAPEKLKGDAAENLARARDLAIGMENCLTEDAVAGGAARISGSDFVVDGLFGTGLTREITGHFAALIHAVNGSHAKVVAVDIPSGLNSDSGASLGVSVRADLTCTYGLAKPGLLVSPGRERVGALEVIDIGIPAAVVSEVGVATVFLENDTVCPFVPTREGSSHKGTFGHLMVVAGSAGKSGAALLCGHGALRSGVGLVTLAAPQTLNAVFEAVLLEAMSCPLLHSRDCFASRDLPQLEDLAAGKGALALGPGLGTEPDTGELVRSLCAGLGIPMVVDADGINLLAREPEVLQKAPALRILTPHPGEMARLTGLTSREVQENRLQVALDFAREYRVFLVLKGAGTIVAAPDGRAAINSTGNPGMAAGGMGDVLTGLIGGLLAQGLGPWEAACLGVYAHGLAADRHCRKNEIGFGYLASEIAAELPGAFYEILAAK